MCGIVGFAGGDRNAEALLSSMTGIIRHRGPDDDGHLIDGDMALGMRRLAIIDVAQGKQPITSDCGRYSIVFNGEIYNFREVRAELEAAGCRFRTHSDTEVILVGYSLWGARCLDRLRGMFTFAILDRRERALFVARDRLGVKPLYYADTGGQWIFGSEIKALLKHPAVGRDVNLAAVDDYLALRYVPGPETLFAGIRKFPAAHYMIWKDGRSSFTRYWRHDALPAWTGSRAEAQEAFDSLFDEATRIRMISERPVGAFLSGGLDSTAIVTSLRRQFPETLKTFSVGFGWEGDELSIAAATARDLGCHHHEIICTPEDTAHLGRIVWNLDEPVGDGIVLPMYLLSRLASQSVTVVQSGEGADEILGGYFTHRVMKWAALYSQLIPGLIQKGLILPAARAMPASLLNLAFDYPGDLGEAGKRRLIEFLTVLASNSTAEQYRFLISLFTPADKQQLYSQNFAQATEALREVRQDQALLDFNGMLGLQYQHWLPDDILCKQDKMTMAHSLEGRVPFMDHRLVELVSSMPAAFKIGPRHNKLLLRDYLRRHRSTAMARRRKVPFYIPIDKYLESAPLKTMVDELLCERSVRRRGLFRWEAVDRIRQASGRGGFLYGKQVFSLAMLELWYRIFVDDEAGWN